jgi:hypothetical protein
VLGDLLPIHYPKALRQKKQQQQRSQPLWPSNLNPQKPHLLRTNPTSKIAFRFPSLRLCALSTVFIVS